MVGRQGYGLSIKTSAAKALQDLPKHDQIRVGSKIEALAAEPRPDGCAKLSGSTSDYRIRSGNYRVVYTIDDTTQLVTINRIAHRKDVYR